MGGLYDAATLRARCYIICQRAWNTVYVAPAASSARDAPERDCALFDIGIDDMGEIAAAARLVRRDSHACLMLGACLADPQAIAWLERAHPDLSQGPADLQSAALTTELCTHAVRSFSEFHYARI